MAPPTRYTASQKAVIVSTVLDQGMTLKEALRQLAAGRLDHNPFPVPYKTAHQWVQRARIDRAETRAENDPLDHLNDLAKRAYVAYVPKAEAVITAMNAGKCSEQRYRETMKTLQVTAQAIKASTTTRQLTPKAQGTQDAKPEHVDIGALLAQANGTPTDGPGLEDAHDTGRDTFPAPSDAHSPVPSPAGAHV